MPRCIHPDCKLEENYQTDLFFCSAVISIEIHMNVDMGSAPRIDTFRAIRESPLLAALGCLGQYRLESTPYADQASRR